MNVSVTDQRTGYGRTKGQSGRYNNSVWPDQPQRIWWERSGHNREDARSYTIWTGYLDCEARAGLDVVERLIDAIVERFWIPGTHPEAERACIGEVDAASRFVTFFTAADR